MKALAIILAAIILAAPVRAAPTFSIAAVAAPDQVSVGTVAAVAIVVTTSGDGVAPIITASPAPGVLPIDAAWNDRGAVQDRPLTITLYYVVTCDAPAGDLPIEVRAEAIGVGNATTSVILHNGPAVPCHHTWAPLISG